MQPYAELLEFNQPNPIRRQGHTRIRDSFPDLSRDLSVHDHSESTGPFDYDDGGIYIYQDPERISEFAGRWDYGSKNAERLGQTAKDGTPIIRKWIESGEQSMLEMAHATFFIECSRVVSHELVRHRLASYQQESQRFTKYEDEDPENEELVFNPGDAETEVTSLTMGYGPESSEEFFKDAYFAGIQAYKDLRAAGVSPQLARYVLPNAMRTRIIMSANLREWRHILKLRLHSSAQPEMRELMQQVYDQLVEVFPQSLEGVLDGERGIR